MRRRSSATQTGFSTPSHSTVASNVARSPAGVASTEATRKRPRTRLPEGTAAGEADAVDAVVQAHPTTGGRQQLVEHGDAQGEGEEAVRDRRPERARDGALAIDVDPLRVVGGDRERVDPLLGDVDPPGGAELDADEIAERAHEALATPERMRASDSSRPRSSRLSYRPGETRDPVTATRMDG